MARFSSSRLLLSVIAFCIIRAMTNHPNSPYNLLMLSGDNSIARGHDGAFYRLLKGFSQYWNRIDILTPTGNGVQETVIHDNIYVHPAPYHRLRQPFFIKQKGEELFKQRDYHLVTSHDFGFFYNGVGAMWLLHGKDIPLVSEVHHVEGYPIAVNMRERLWRFTAQRYFPIMGKRATAFRVVNDNVGKILQTMGVPESKIRLLYSLYMDFDIYRPAETPIDKQYDVLFVGRLASNKGINLLIDAIKIVAQSIPTIRLGIRGEGNLRDSLNQKIADYGLSENIIFLPRVAKTDDMADLYQQAKMLVCASTVEGNPRVTIEAMACGVPVISTPVGIMPDVIKDGQNGFLFDWDVADLAEKIQRLLSDDTLRGTFSKAGQESVQKFDADTMIRNYALAYHAIIESKNHSD